jgi:hypothetical protein
MKRNLLFINILHTMQNKLQTQASKTDICQVSSIITIPTFTLLHLNWQRHHYTMKLVVWDSFNTLPNLPMTLAQCLLQSSLQEAPQEKYTAGRLDDRGGHLTGWPTPPTLHN